ncbi:PNCB phosphoribosyltransferase, partial [Hypocryptadius cinnamomeus]|nr:PNCB phosphoribosyltransferase [Hypocryptadius cinnamomeus]
MAPLADLYQVSMAYGHWRAGRQRAPAAAELFFRRPPFRGSFALGAGLAEGLRGLRAFRFSAADVAYLRSVLPSTIDDAFFDYLATLDASEVTVTAIPEGSVVFARVPFLQVKGPLLVVQLLETTLLCLINYASLVATNAARFRLLAGPDMKLIEMGLRRAQGPDGALSASKYSYIGGFDCTSNILAGKLYGIPVRGTIAHSFIMSFRCLEEVQPRGLQGLPGAFSRLDIPILAPEQRGFIPWSISVASSGSAPAAPRSPDVGPQGWSSSAGGVSPERGRGAEFPPLLLPPLWDQPRTQGNSRCQHWVMAKSLPTRSPKSSTGRRRQNAQLWGGFRVFCLFSADFHQLPPQRGHRFPSLLPQLVEVNGSPCLKLTEDEEKMTIPGMKAIYRLYDAAGHPFMDLMALEEEPSPSAGQELGIRVLGRLEETTKVIPTTVESLHRTYFRDGQVCEPLPSLPEVRTHAQVSLNLLSPAHRRLHEPQPYPVAVTERLHQLFLELRQGS